MRRTYYKSMAKGREGKRVREISKDGGKIFYKNSVLNDLVKHIIPFG